MANSSLPELRLNIKVHGRHPNFFRKQCKKPKTPLPAGSLVFVKDREGRPVGTGFYNPRSNIALRLLDHGKKPADPSLVSSLLDEALAFRRRLGLAKKTEAYRLVHAEGDGLPGLVVDRLGTWIVAELAAKGYEPYLEDIGERLLQEFPGAHLVLRLNRDAAKTEGFSIRDTQVRAEGQLEEYGLRYHFTPGQGHKTGFFCDQRENRLLLRRLAGGRRVLDLCCHAGGFALNAAKGGAKRVAAYDLDEEAVALARANAKTNRLKVRVAQADAFEICRGDKLRDTDLLILDPPKWIHSKGEREEGLRRYRDLNRLAFAALPRGAQVLSCSCSGLLDEGGFLLVLREAAAQAKREIRILRCTGAGPDHPVSLACPETRYLKAIWMEIRT
ncbi:MAG TPA: class I SAM-dependent rRNA methyltransferase [Planctomycetes bacterium]|nr:class I SAM-dependent rRNA methyltransferase [Planctomycetota bacterium]